MRFELNEKEKGKFVSLFHQHEQNIAYLQGLSRWIWQDNALNKTIFEKKNTFEKRTIFVDKLIEKEHIDNPFVKNAIRWDINLIDHRSFSVNPYLSILKNVTFNENDWSLTNKSMLAYSLFPYEEEYHYGSDMILKMNLGFFDNDYSYPTLSLCENDWMSLNPFEIRTMEVPIQLTRGKVLMLGLGLGYFAFMAHLKEEVKEIHIVEMDIDLIKNFEKHLLPLFPHKEKIHIHKADAFYFIECVKDHDYDYIFSDLWHDVGDGLPMYIRLKKAFKDFKYTKCTYWIEGSLITYLRLLVIGVLKDEFYQESTDYDETQSLIKENLKNTVVKNSYDLDTLLSISGLLDIVL